MSRTLRCDIYVRNRDSLSSKSRVLETSTPSLSVMDAEAASMASTPPRLATIALARSKYCVQAWPPSRMSTIPRTTVAAKRASPLSPRTLESAERARTRASVLRPMARSRDLERTGPGVPDLERRYAWWVAAMARSESLRASVDIEKPRGAESASGRRVARIGFTPASTGRAMSSVAECWQKWRMRPRSSAVGNQGRRYWGLRRLPAAVALMADSSTGSGGER